MNDLFEQAVTAYRARLTDALEQMRSARSAEAFCETERLLLTLVHELAGEMTQRVLQEVSDDPVRVREAMEGVRERAAGRGITIRPQGRRKTLIRTVGGQEISIFTSYAMGQPRGSGTKRRRGAQGSGVYPVLDELGIAGRSTPALRLLVGRAVCEANSVASARELLTAGGVDIDHKQALRLTYMVTEDALRAREAAVQATTDGNDAGPFAGRRVVASVDGGRLQIRRRVAGRPKKGGRKRFVTEWREPKVLTIYVLGEDGRRDRAVPSVIDGTLGDADAVFDLLRYHLRRLGAHRALDLTLVGDGAPWIWNRTDALRSALGLPRERFHEVVDYFHVVERLGEIARRSLDGDDDAHRAWLGILKRFLKAGNIEEIERVVATASYDERDMDLDYLATNRHRMRYARLRQRGLPLGSGAVESAVRRVVNLRMKGASVFWTEEHAEGILHLRAHAKSGRWRELERAVLSTTGWRPTARLRRSDAA